MGQILLDGIKMEAPIGVYNEEKSLKRSFEVSISAEVAFENQALDDKISNTVDYEEIYRIVNHVMAEPCNLMETAAAKIGEMVNAKYPQISSLKVKISKANPLLNGKVFQSCIEWHG